jgi:hypothetical protein
MLPSMLKRAPSLKRALWGALFAAFAASAGAQDAGDKRPPRVSAPASDLSAAYAFPVPFKPSTTSTRITFTNLSTEATIRIYSSSGELVRTLREDQGNGFLRWDVTNEQGQPVASDVYFYVIENAEQTKVGKLLVVR